MLLLKFYRAAISISRTQKRLKSIILFIPRLMEAYFPSFFPFSAKFFFFSFFSSAVVMMVIVIVWYFLVRLKKNESSTHNINQSPCDQSELWINNRHSKCVSPCIFSHIFYDIINSALSNYLNRFYVMLSAQKSMGLIVYWNWMGLGNFF